MKLGIDRGAVEEIDRHACEAYPDECCGVVLWGGGRDHVRRITNIQNRLHAEDPREHPRDARIAYFMEPKELYAVLREAETAGRRILAFYHSHPEYGAYFSEEDKARAMAWDEPAYPEACQIVVSVVAGAVRERIAVAWDERSREFAEVDLAIR